MDDTDRDRIEQLCEALGEAMAAIAALREDLTAIAEAQRQNSAALQLHGHELARLTAALERVDLGRLQS